MDIERRAELIARYRMGVEEVEAALTGADETELDAVPPDGGWTVRMVVHHPADSESNSYLRVRTLLAEDEPFIRGYDEERFAEQLHYDRPAEASLAVFRAVRAFNRGAPRPTRRRGLEPCGNAQRERHLLDG